MNKLVAAALSATMILSSTRLHATSLPGQELLVSTSRIQIWSNTHDDRDTEFQIQHSSGETMSVAVSMSPSRDRATVSLDGELGVTYYFTPGNGAKARELTHYEVEYRGERVVAPAIHSANEKIIPEASRRAAELMSNALLELHTAEFYAQVASELLNARASGGVIIEGWIGCTSSTIGLLASYASFLACATVIGCVGAVILHQIAVAGFICSCIGDC